MTNNTSIPATGAMPFPMIFTREKQPYSVEEIIMRRAATFGVGGGLGYSIFQNKPVVEINTPSNNSEEFAGFEVISPYILVAVKYKSPGSDRTYLTANLYSLLRSNGAGAGFVIDPKNGNTPASELMLVPLGSHAD